MRKLDLSEIHSVTLDLMDSLHEICEKNGIKYYLMFGSLIGAIRHKGFIPWDDDFDVCMLRDDFNKFCNIVNSQNNTRYKLLTRANTKNYFLCFPKYCDSMYEYSTDLNMKHFDMGVYIDIFPFDSCGETMEATAIVHKVIQKINWEYAIYINKLCITSKQNLFTIARSFCKIPYHYILRLKYGKNFPQVIDKMMENIIYENFDKDSKYVASYYEDKDFKLYERRWFSERELSKFENRKYWIPKEYDKILRLTHGD